MTTLTPLRVPDGRRAVPALAVLALVLAGCSSVGTATLTFWDVVFSMIVFFFWFMFIWIFIALFGDIFRRDDLSGGAKAGWIFLLVILPFLGALIYMIVRPKVTASDIEQITRAEAAYTAAAKVTPADQIAKLQELRAAGAISEEEFQALKQKAIGA
jgi:uncharacterized membrane protein